MQLIIAASLIVSIVASSGAMSTVQASGAPSGTLIPHDVIRANSEAELSALITDNGWSGTGVIDDPYVIENLEIDATGYGAGIFVGNITSHLIIRDCSVSNAENIIYPYHDGGGIALYNVVNATVENNDCNGNFQGIRLAYSNGNTISNNECNGDDYGINLLYSNGNTISNNECNGNGYQGIYLVYSNGNTISNNDCSDNNYGVYLFHSNGNTISNNECNGNTRGIYLVESDGNIISNNECNGNTQYGIRMDFSRGNTIYGNVLVNNNGASSEYSSSNIQAYDNGNNNWNSTSYGNRWVDWTAPDANGDGIVDSPYAIAGGSNADNCPMVPVFVSIDSPIDGTIVSGNAVLVTGTASPGYKLVVNGIVVHVNDDSTFAAVVSLLDGENVIKASLPSVPLDVMDTVTVVYVNELPDIKDGVDDLTDRLDHISSRLSNAESLLDATRTWLLSISERLTTCYDAHNVTAEEVSSTLVQVQTMRSSLIELRSSLNSTDGNVTGLMNDLDNVIADLVTAETSLTTVQSNLVTAENNISSLQSDSMPLTLSALGLIAGLTAVALLVLMQVRKPRTP